MWTIGILLTLATPAWADDAPPAAPPAEEAPPSDAPPAAEAAQSDAPPAAEPPLAVPPPPAAPQLADGFRPDRHWTDVYRRANAVSTVGLVSAIAGPLVGATGIVLFFAGGLGADAGVMGSGMVLILGGSVMTLVGVPMLAAGSLRARHALEAQGLYVDPSLGYLAWGMYGGALLVGVVAPQWNGAGAASAALYAGGIVAGSSQRVWNTRAIRRAGFTASSVEWTVSPWVVGASRGVAVAGIF